MIAKVYPIEQALEDSLTLADLADAAGVTMTQARAFCAALAEVPIRQAVRICSAAETSRRRRA